MAKVEEVRSVYSGSDLLKGMKTDDWDLLTGNVCNTETVLQLVDDKCCLHKLQIFDLYRLSVGKKIMLQTSQICTQHILLQTK
ncbi:hypothetical protein J6590_087754 [Homalodisca vitripennis]|nr:hypothetical protein J6590_087754 [Homalodisca vitripennis]